MENAREAHYRNGLKIIRNPWGDCHGGRSLGKRQHWGILQISPSLSSALLRECLPHPLSISQSWVNKDNQVSANSLDNEKACWKSTFLSNLQELSWGNYCFICPLPKAQLHASSPEFFVLYFKNFAPSRLWTNHETPHHRSGIHENSISVHFSFHTN